MRIHATRIKVEYPLSTDDSILGKEVIMFRNSLMALVLTLAANSAQAGLLFEPYVGYAKGTSNYTFNSADPDPLQAGKSFTSEISGLSYGGRAGFIYTSFLLAAEYQALSARQHIEGSALSTAWISETIFGVLGINVFGLRLLGGTSLSHKAKDLGTPERMFWGSAYKVGLGYQYKMPLAINAEYIVYTLNEVQTGVGAKQKITELYEKHKYTAFMVSFSFPFIF